ncbi:MAG: MATE family efflux transporter [Aeromicrobium sp.]
MGLLTRDDRHIFALAAPAFAALISEPLMLLADTAIIGHLGTVQLAGLAVAATVLGTIVGLCIFLAYGSTAAVARHHGAGDERGALALGLSGIWLAVGLGVVLAASTALLAGPVTRGLASSPDVAEQAHTYLLISTLGLPAMLVVLAATGALRGVLDMRTPLIAMIAANSLNVVLNLGLVYGADWGIGGAATGTVIAQWVAAVWLAGSVLRKARAAGSAVRPDAREILDSARNGVPLVIRTLTLRASLLIATAVAATQGDASLAAHQIAVTLVTLLSFSLDAIAIAGQALTGRSLGAADPVRTRQLTRRMIGWGVVSGVVAGLLLLAVHGVIPSLFSPDAQVQSALLPVLVVVAVIQPLSGVVFVLDGVLIGAGDGAFLAWAGLAVLVVYTPLALAVQRNDAGLTWLWVAYGGFIAARLVTLYARQRGDRWMVLGA